jgi:hypothetical protein
LVPNQFVFWIARIPLIAGPIMPRRKQSSNAVVLKSLVVASPARRGVVDDRKIGGASDMSELARALATHRLGKPAAAPLLDRLRRCVLDQSKRALEKHAQRRPVPISSVSIA